MTQDVLTAVPYTFARPPRVSSENIGALDAGYAQFALSVQGMLSSRLRQSVEATVSTLGEETGADYIASLASPCAAFVVEANDHSGTRGVVEVTTPFAYHLVDRLFGGSGEQIDLSRGLTALEQSVVRVVVERVMELFASSWAEDLHVKPQIAAFESRPEMVRILQPTDRVLVARLEVRSGPFTGPFSVCLPVSLFDAVLERSTGVRPRASEGDAASARQNIIGHVRQATVHVAVRLPALRLTTRAMAGLEPGQVIHTLHPADDPVEVMVNGRLRYMAALGQLRGHVGARITQIVDARAADRTRRPRQGRVE